jgi:hypothetical protein
LPEACAWHRLRASGCIVDDGRLRRPPEVAPHRAGTGAGAGGWSRDLDLAVGRRQRRQGLVAAAAFVLEQVRVLLSPSSDLILLVLKPAILYTSEGDRNGPATGDSPGVIGTSVCLREGLIHVVAFEEDRRRFII